MINVSLLCINICFMRVFEQERLAFYAWSHLYLLDGRITRLLATITAEDDENGPNWVCF